MYFKEIKKLHPLLMKMGSKMRSFTYKVGISADILPVKQLPLFHQESIYHRI